MESSERYSFAFWSRFLGAVAVIAVVVSAGVILATFLLLYTYGSAQMIQTLGISVDMLRSPYLGVHVFRLWLERAFFDGAAWAKWWENALPTAWRIGLVLLFGGFFGWLALWWTRPVRITDASGRARVAKRRAILLFVSFWPVVAIGLALPGPLRNEWIAYAFVGIADGFIAEMMVNASGSYQQLVAAQYIDEAMQMGASWFSYYTRAAAVHLLHVMRSRIVFLISQVIILEQLFVPLGTGSKGLGTQLVYMVQSAANDYSTVEPWFALILVSLALTVTLARATTRGLLFIVDPAFRDRFALEKEVLALL